MKGSITRQHFFYAFITAEVLKLRRFCNVPATLNGLQRSERKTKTPSPAASRRPLPQVWGRGVAWTRFSVCETTNQPHLSPILGGEVGESSSRVRGVFSSHKHSAT